MLQTASVIAHRGRYAAGVLNSTFQNLRGSAWSSIQAESYEALAALSPTLWEEAEETHKELNEKASWRLEGLDHLNIGGGADCRLLYFLTRLNNVSTAVETGVAAGWSTAALLRALEANGGEGRLWSSDRPYSRPQLALDYTPYIGLLVDEELKTRWELFTRSDNENLPRILQSAGGIDLFHYDSQKSYRARMETLERIIPFLNPKATVIVDDIGDNMHFRDWTNRHGFAYRVLRYGRKFIGVVGI